MLRAGGTRMLNRKEITVPDAVRTARISARMRRRERAVVEAAAEVRGVHISEIVRAGSLREARRALRGDGDGRDAPDGDGRGREASA